jgi:glycosyltransferase involved in cell wall biosynthesis
LPRLTRLQTRAAWELILVDNGSSDGTRDVLAAFAASSGLDACVVHEPHPGLAAARNTGWRRARGRVVAFTDDDCYPAPDYVDQLLACFREAELGYLGGRVLLFDPRDARVTIQESRLRVDIAPRSFLRTGLVHGANMAVCRDALERSGGFDERFGAGTALYCAEDVDLLARASALGYRGAYDPRPTVLHHHRRTSPEEVERLLAGYDIGRGAYYAKALADRRMRAAYLWPVLRKVGGNLWRREFAVMGRELRGAWSYFHDEPRRCACLTH